MIQPADKAVLNFTQVMFEFDEYPGADTYVLRYYHAGSSEVNIRRTSSLACMVNIGLSFGGKYQWYYEAWSKKKPIFKSKVFTFSIAQSFLIIGDQFRYKILRSMPDSFQNNLVFIDNLGVAVNRRGEPVWYMPNDSADSQQKIPQYRNLDITNTGTFTFLRGDQCYEKDLYGKQVWQGPNDGVVSGAGREWYHHDFLKAPDGTYFICSYRYDSTKDYYNPLVNIQVRYNTVIQYNSEGKVLWHWNEKDHVSGEEILKTSGQVSGVANGTHMNGFAWNSQQQQFIFSFRNNSTLLKVDKATGDVIYRLRGDEGTPFGVEANFYNQHSPVYTSSGNVLLYNNNAPPKTEKAGVHYPHIMIMNIPDGKSTPRLLWEYECVMKEYPDGWIGKEGYAGQLPNGNILVCVGGANKIFEVTPGKKVVWEMNCEMYSSRENKWVPFNNYRSHFTSSLYPQYFTVQNPKGNWKINSLKPVSIKINNDGTDNETYIVELFSNNAFKPFKTTVKLKAGTSVVQTIAYKRNAAVKLSKPAVAVLRVTPVSNPAGAKDYTMPIQNIR